VGIAVGRIGCFLSGLPDGTYGTPTSLPWGVDFGDGISRHPTAIYESIFMLAFAAALSRVAPRFANGQLFNVFMAGYLAFRLIVDGIKPGLSVALGLTSIQLACIAGLAICVWRLSRVQQPAVVTPGVH
jgi:phosphatidylglycerol:prolipoprotein diacylglycerol transferase